MKYKKTLFILFFIALFAFWQTQVEAKNLPDVGSLSIKQSPNAAGLPSTVLVFMKEFDSLGRPTNIFCYETDTSDGCVQRGSGLAYPPSSQYITFESAYAPAKNPIRVDIEHYYLYNVLPREMDVATYDPTLAALKAQALAARSIADWKAVLDPNTGKKYITNVTTTQVFVPGSFDYYNPAAKGLIQQAVDETSGQYLYYYDGLTGDSHKLSIDAEFSNDIDSPTLDGKQSYLISVQDPISPSCDLSPLATRGNGWGMSQKGAMRWSKGNQCPSASGGNMPWPVKWDYKQILAHYYTGVDFKNDNTSAKFAPNDRWNLLKHDSFGVPSGTSPSLTSGISYPIKLTLQNTSSTSGWTDSISPAQFSAAGCAGCSTFLSRAG